MSLNGNNGSIEGASISGGTIAGATIIGNNMTLNGALLVTYTDANIPLGSLGYGLSGEAGGLGIFSGSSSIVATLNGPSLKYNSGGEVTAYSNGALIKYQNYSSVTCGASGTYLVGSVCQANGSNIATSDANVKNSISYDLDPYEEVFDGLLPCIYKYNNGTSGRYHTGFIAQNVLESLKNAGLTADDFAAYCEVEWPGEEEMIRGLRYEEFVALNTWQIQKLKARVEALEQMIGG